MGLVGYTKSEFIYHLLRFRDVFVSEDFDSAYITSIFSELNMYGKSDVDRKNLFDVHSSINIGLDLEEEYLSLFSVSNHNVGWGVTFKKLLFHDIALCMYDVLGSFTGGDNPFFDENDDILTKNLIKRVQCAIGDENVNCSDYKSTLTVATDFIQNNRNILIDEILNEDNSNYAKSFYVEYFYDGWISSFVSTNKVRMNIFLDHIYIDEMRTTLNGIAAQKWGSNDDKVLLSLVMPRVCNNPENSAYDFYPTHLKNFQFGVRDIASLYLCDDGKIDLLYG